MIKISGFTLLELMVTLVIAAILLIIASPSYESYEARAQRNRAEVALLRLSSRLERYFDENNSYAGATDKKLHVDNLVRGLLYQLALVSVSDEHFTIQARPLGAQARRDGQCGALGLSDLNVKTVSGEGDVNACWR